MGIMDWLKALKELNKYYSEHFIDYRVLDDGRIEIGMLLRLEIDEETAKRVVSTLDTILTSLGKHGKIPVKVSKKELDEMKKLKMSKYRFRGLGVRK